MYSLLWIAILFSLTNIIANCAAESKPIQSVDFGPHCTDSCRNAHGSISSVSRLGGCSYDGNKTTFGLPSAPLISFDVILDGKDVTQVITLRAPNDGTNDNFQALVIKSTRTDNGEQKCATYKFTGPFYTSNESCSIEYCVPDGKQSYYHEIHSLPQSNPQQDYIHRLITVKHSSHKIDSTSTSSWQPRFIEIHNDSCTQNVKVKFPLAPSEYNFTDYAVDIKHPPSSSRPQQSIRLKVDVKDDVFGIVTFQAVPNGEYLIQIIAEPDRDYSPNTCKCKMSRFKCEMCCSSNSTLFSIDDRHKKCLPPESRTATTVAATTVQTVAATTVQTTVPAVADVNDVVEYPGNVTSMNYIFAFVALIIVTLAICVVVYLCLKARPADPKPFKPESETIALQSISPEAVSGTREAREAMENPDDSIVLIPSTSSTSYYETANTENIPEFDKLLDQSMDFDGSSSFNLNLRVY